MLKAKPCNSIFEQVPKNFAVYEDDPLSLAVRVKKITFFLNKS